MALWGLGTVLAPAPLRLAGPVMAALTVVAMRWSGRGGAGPVFGPALPWGRCLAFALAPVVTAVTVAQGWVMFGGVAVNVPVALTTGAAGLGLWLWLLVAAFRQRAGAPR